MYGLVMNDQLADILDTNDNPALLEALSKAAQHTPKAFTMHDSQITVDEGDEVTHTHNHNHNHLHPLVLRLFRFHGCHCVMCCSAAATASYCAAFADPVPLLPVHLCVAF